MSVDVNGDGNRVAGRDYYENQNKPCQKCEVRFVAVPRQICNHCGDLERQEKYKVLGFTVLAAFFFIFVHLHEWRIERGASSGLDNVVESGIYTGLIVFLCLVVYGFIKEWFSNRDR